MYMFVIRMAVWHSLQALPNGGIKIFASQLHTHLTGKRAYTKHYRRGVELSELSRDNHYSPHYQEIRKLKKQVHILPVSIKYHKFLTNNSDFRPCGSTVN